MTDEIRIDPRGIDAETFTQIGITSKLQQIKERKSREEQQPKRKKIKKPPSLPTDEADSFGHEQNEDPITEKDRGFFD